MFRTLLLACLLFMPALLLADEPRVPVVVDVNNLTEKNVPLHMERHGAIFKTGGPALSIVVKKIKINKQYQPDDRTVTLNVDLSGTECGKPFSGPVVITYCLSNHDRWGVCKIDATATTYYRRMK